MTDGIERDAPDRGELRRASRRGVLVNYAAQFLKFGLQVVYSVLLARLLIPEDFGLVAMAAPVLALASTLSDLGFAQAIVQRESISRAQLSFLFWTNILLNGTVMLVLVLCAGLVGDLYREPQVAPVLIALATLMFLGSISGIHFHLLSRRMAFSTAAMIDLGTFLLGAVAGLVAAWQGYGLWSIIINQAVLTLAAAIAIWTIVRWQPGRFNPRLPEGREMLGFGSNIAVFNIANYFARNLDKVLIGRVWGEGPLGLYDRSYKLMTLPLSQVTTPIAKVALPLLSRLKSDTKAYTKAFFAILEMAMIIIMPISIFGFVASYQIIEVLFGIRWIEAAPIFAVLSFGAPFAPVSHGIGWLLITQNRTAEMRNYGLVSSIGFAAAIVVGLPWGAFGVAAAYIGYGVIQGPVTWWLSTRGGIIPTREFFAALAPYVVAAVPTGLAVALVQRALPHGFLTLCLLGLLSFVVFLGLLLAQPRARRSFMVLVDELDTMMGGRIGRWRSSWASSRLAGGRIGE